MKKKLAFTVLAFSVIHAYATDGYPTSSSTIGVVTSNSEVSNNVQSSQLQGQQQGQIARSSSISKDSNNASQTVSIQNTRQPVASAATIAVMPTSVCAGSTGGGAQGSTFGISFGTSWTDDNCMLLEQVRTVVTLLGDRNTAEEMLCSVETYREARAVAGRPCSGRLGSTENNGGTSVRYTDPFIRSRLGLPPLAGQSQGVRN